MNQKSKSSSSSSKSATEPRLASGVVAGASAAATAVATLVYAVLLIRQSSWFRSQMVGIIPARFSSSRCLGKPLVAILGKPMIQRTWERAKPAAKLNKLVVATDDQKIAECCSTFGADVLMTSESCQNGTERCNEALQKLQRKFDIIVNIQGDEPLIDPEIIDGIVKALQAAPHAVYSTAVTSLKPEDALDPNRVKCAVDTCGYAIYFSRGLIPYNRSGKVNPSFSYLLHLVIQGYDTKFLRKYLELLPLLYKKKKIWSSLKSLSMGTR